MASVRRYPSVVFVFVIFSLVSASPKEKKSATRFASRVHIPLLGFGPYCYGCPTHYCDDDPAIVYGYCCGCASFYDGLPVTCSSKIECPLNIYDLCQDYEYMMHCCC